MHLKLLMMMRIKSGSILVVAPAASGISLPAYKKTTHVTGMTRIFPAIHATQPSGIVLDYDFMGDDIQKVLRRLTGNSFYNKIKIYCYKSKPHTRVDGLLQALGVQYFIYAPEEKTAKQVNPVKALGEMLEDAVANTLAPDTSY